MKSKKDAAAEFHRERILQAAEILFSEKGFEKTTIDDISKLSEYSRRTIYAYFSGKEDIMNHITAKGLSILKSSIAAVISKTDDFFVRYREICTAMKGYTVNCPHSSGSVNKSNTENLQFDKLSESAKSIIVLGEEINALLVRFVEDGKNSGIVRQNVKSVPTVYILWSSIFGLFELIKTKGAFLTKSLGMTEDEFSEYGFEQIINSIIK